MIEKSLIYRGCFRHRGFSQLCDDCSNSARAAMVEIIIQQERRIDALEKQWEERLNGNLDTEYNRATLRGEIETLRDPRNPPSRATIASVIKGGPVTPSTGSNRSVGEREDSVGRRRRRQEFDSLGILHEEGGDQR